MTDCQILRVEDKRTMIIQLLDNKGVKTISLKHDGLPLDAMGVARQTTFEKPILAQVRLGPYNSSRFIFEECEVLQAYWPASNKAVRHKWF